MQHSATLARIADGQNGFDPSRRVIHTSQSYVLPMESLEAESINLDKVHNQALQPSSYVLGVNNPDQSILTGSAERGEQAQNMSTIKDKVSFYH